MTSSRIFTILTYLMDYLYQINIRITCLPVHRAKAGRTGRIGNYKRTVFMIRLDKTGLPPGIQLNAPLALSQRSARRSNSLKVHL